jgi:hypothetical protein
MQMHTVPGSGRASLKRGGESHGTGTELLGCIRSSDSIHPPSDVQVAFCFSSALLQEPSINHCTPAEIQSRRQDPDPPFPLRRH